MTARNAICLCTDKNMVIPALFVAAAAQKKSAAHSGNYDVLLFTSPPDITDAHRRWAEARNIRLIDDVDTSLLDGIKIRMQRVTNATLLRLLAPEYLAGRYNKILYLDADVTIHDEIAPVFLLDTGDSPLAAVGAARNFSGAHSRKRAKTEEHLRALGMTEPYRYFNSGVLLIDIAKWNREELGSRALHFLRQKPDVWILPDEDALNAILNGRQPDLSPLWNMRAKPWAHPLIREFADPVIVHYDGPNKPWKRFRRNRRLFEHQNTYRLYEAFLRDTPLPNWLDEQWTFRDLRENLAFELRAIVRSMRGKGNGPDRAAQRAYQEAFRRYCATERFADVEQGIVAWEDGRFRLVGGRGTERDHEFRGQQE